MGLATSLPANHAFSQVGRIAKADILSSLLPSRTIPTNASRTIPTNEEIVTQQLQDEDYSSITAGFCANDDHDHTLRHELMTGKVPDLN